MKKSGVPALSEHICEPFLQFNLPKTGLGPFPSVFMLIEEIGSPNPVFERLGCKKRFAECDRMIVVHRSLSFCDLFILFVALCNALTKPANPVKTLAIA